MHVHSREKIEKLKELRANGYSISQLMSELSMPKTTVWHHIQKISLSQQAIALIKSRQSSSKIRSENNWKRARDQAKKLLKNKHRYACSLAAMLYWAEGNRKGFVFTNTDGRMVKLFLTILREDFEIKEEDIKLTIRIFDNLNKRECVAYWSRVTGLPKKKFMIYLNDGATKGKARYGICRLAVRKSGNLFKLTSSLIDSIYGEVVNI